MRGGFPAFRELANPVQAVLPALPDPFAMLDRDLPECAVDNSEARAVTFGRQPILHVRDRRV